MRPAVGEKWPLMSVCISWLTVGIDKAWSGSGIALYSPRLTIVSLISILFAHDFRTKFQNNNRLINIFG